MLLSKPSPLWMTIAAIVFLIIVSLTASRLSHQATSRYKYNVLKYSHLFESSSFSSIDTFVLHPQNATLGFEKVFAIGLPERSDKRDALALTSSLTGFTIDWIDGVRGESIPDKAVPFGTDRVKLWENNLGSWRGHLNAVRRIVEHGYQSALIMEDDMDWDVRLKAQLQQFATGARFIQSTAFSKQVPSSLPTAFSEDFESPYGNNWDLLWLGHCGEVFPEQLPEYQPASNASESRTPLPVPEKFVISPDPTVPPPQHVTGFQNYTASPHTRWVHVTGGPICTFAYALSLTGARKVLYDLSVDHLLGPFDNALANLCRYGNAVPEHTEEPGLGMRCISVTPPLFFHHKAKGFVDGDSDIQVVGGDKEKGEEQEVRKEGRTENIDMSARGNVKNLILGLQPISQYPDEEHK